MANKRIERVEINVAVNGYYSVANPFRGGGNDSAPYVFESFDSLTAWLRENLAKPEES